MDYCCGGTTSKIPNGRYVSDAFGCVEHDLADYERTYELALKYTTPLPVAIPSDNNKNNYSNNNGDTPNHQIKCDVCQIVNTLMDQNLTMMFLGDSVTHQQSYGWMCALQMRNYQVEQRRASVPEYDQTSFEMHISSPHINNTARVIFLHTYVFAKNLTGLFDGIDIVVANYGVHWAINAPRAQQGPGNYQMGLTALFQHLSLGPPSVRPRLLAFRETAAQHFGADGGEYFLPRVTNEQQRCIPHPSQTTWGWREAMLSQVAREHNFTVKVADALLGTTNNADDPPREIVWLPFLNFTTELYFLHPISRGKDCTHFCQTPFVWMPLWRSLRLAVDRTFGY